MLKGLEVSVEVKALKRVELSVKLRAKKVITFKCRHFLPLKGVDVAA